MLLERAVEERWAERVWERDASLWTDDPAVAASISGRLGWLDAPEHFSDRVETLQAFAAGVRSEGFAQAIVCGMGGSSLAPEVLARSLTSDAAGLPVYVLDSTDPVAAVASREVYDPRQTLYIIASKSGTTTETLAFLAYFWAAVGEVHDAIPTAAVGQHFVAVTDPDQSLAAIPHSGAFRSVFLNPPDVGGRYSALTYVGLVPGALLGIDLAALLDGGRQIALRCRENGIANPALELGVAMAAMARAGRDKLTLLIEPDLASFGAWAEQLIAESTGKHGVGVVPIEGEPPGAAASYGFDRFFVRLARADADGSWRGVTDQLLEELTAAGHPVLDLTVGKEGLGGEFFRWEFATALAGIGLDVNPFDEPNVTESKENTRRVLDVFRASGSLPEARPIAAEGILSLVPDAALRLTSEGVSFQEELRRHLARLRADGFVSLQAYLASVPERDAALAELRRTIRDRTGRATTAGYGPRFLHSTGQLHKGGPRSGCFIQLVVGHPVDAPIPGSAESFATLIDAQAMGDFDSLESHELPVVRIHLSDDPEAGLEALQAALGLVLPNSG
ncbi:hypothetical protein BH20CHL6_BH20CHL6_18470 [soil metagenome]